MKELSEALWKNGSHLLYLTACALQGKTPAAEQVAAMDLPGIYRLAKWHSMRAVSYYGVKAWLDASGQAPAEAQEALAKWKEAYNKAIRKNLLFDIEREGLEVFMEQQGIWYMPLKGTLLKEWYPQAGMREMADNDILFDVAFRQKVHDFMVANGYEDAHYIAPEENGEEPVAAGVHDNYYKQPIYNFEMHFALFCDASSPVWTEYYKDVKDRLVPVEGTSYRYRFTDEDFYVYMTTHASKHFNGGGHGMRNLMDVVVFLKTKPHMDMGYIEQELTKLGLAEHEKNVRALACKVFEPAFWEAEAPLEALTEAERELLALCISAGTYGTTERLVENSLKKMSDKNEITLANRLTYLKKRLFADKSTYLVLYPQLAKHKWLLPFCVIHRMFRGLFTARKRLWGEMKSIWRAK